MKIKLLLIAEVEAPNVMVARRTLDAFRESVSPFDNYGISLYEDYSEARTEREVEPCVQMIDGRVCGSTNGVIWTDLVGWICADCLPRVSASVTQD